MPNPHHASPDPARSHPAVTFFSVLGCLCALALALRLWHRGVVEHDFDDSFMFFRYAMNMRHGFGIAWNPGGPHTFGVTSLTWLAVIFLGTFVSSHAVPLVIGASVLSGLAALAAIAWAISRRARTPLLARPALLFTLVAVPLLLDEHFDVSFASGMETMLALLLSGLFVDRLLALVGRSTTANALLLTLVGVLLVLTRPEAILLVLLTPPLAWLLLLRRRGTPALLLFFASSAALLALILLANRTYFGSALPLAFYIKSLHGYRGYRLYLNPAAYTLFFLSMAAIPLLLCAAFARRRDLPLLLTFGLPVAAVLLYLLGVLQIMGIGTRYYIPLLPFVLIPGFLVLDSTLAEALPSPRLRLSPGRLAVLAVALLLTGSHLAFAVQQPLGRLLSHSRRIYQDPVWTIASRLEIPLRPRVVHIVEFTNFAQQLPPGTTIAATEVGYLGGLALNTNILDIAGLNDTHIALHGFTPNDLFAANPDVLWLPHPDYTYLLGTLVVDPRLLGRYDVYVGAFNYSVALNRDSPRFPAIRAAFFAAFHKAYPGLDPELFRATAVTWDAHTTLPLTAIAAP